MNGAVILGDLVDSHRHDADALDRTMAELAQAVQSLGGLVGDAHFTRFRGDGWQLVTLRPEMALRIAVILMARLAAAGGPLTRVAIGLGQIDSLAGGNLGAASGSAFLRSGQMLDQMNGRRRLVLAGAPQIAAGLIDAQLQLIEYVAERWSQPQAEALVLALSPGWDTLADLSARLGITRQAVQLRLKAGGFGAIQAAIQAFEAFGLESPHA